MKYLLDTNICIYIIKTSPPSVIEKFHSLKVGDIGVSSITLAELEYGVSKSAYKAKNQEALNQFIIPLEVLSFDCLAAKSYGEIRSALEQRGKTIGSMDMMIAAHALSQDIILVTNDEKEFSRIHGLKVENWVSYA